MLAAVKFNYSSTYVLMVSWFPETETFPGEVESFLETLK